MKIQSIFWLLFLESILLSCKTKVDIENVEWYAREFNGEPVSTDPNSSEVYFKLDPGENQFTGILGCNRVFGTYEIAADTLKTGPLASTRMSCGEETDQLEYKLIQIIDNNPTFMIQENQLTLTHPEYGAATFIIETE